MFYIFDNSLIGALFVVLSFVLLIVLIFKYFDHRREILIDEREMLRFNESREALRILQNFVVNNESPQLGTRSGSIMNQPLTWTKENGFNRPPTIEEAMAFSTDGGSDVAFESRLDYLDEKSKMDIQPSD